MTWCLMPTPILLPDLGAGTATISVWYANVGDPVFEGERVVEVLVAGATFEVTAPAGGRLLAKAAYDGDQVTPGQVLGMIGEGNTA